MTAAALRIGIVGLGRLGKRHAVNLGDHVRQVRVQPVVAQVEQLAVRLCHPLLHLVRGLLVAPAFHKVPANGVCAARNVSESSVRTPLTSSVVR